MANSKIDWTDKVWNPVTGCSKVSPGCANCYAERQSKRHAGRFGYPVDNPFRVTLHPDRLDMPLKWTKPWKVFVNSMSDLFHPDVPFEFIREVWLRMGLARKHNFQVLTKRPARMKEFFDWMAMQELKVESYLPNVWVGVSVEDQARADERIPLLLQTPVEVHWVSCEPLLGPIDLTRWLGGKSVDQSRADISCACGNRFVFGGQPWKSLETQTNGRGQQDRQPIVRSQSPQSGACRAERDHRVSESNVQLQPRENDRLCSPDSLDVPQQSGYPQWHGDQPQGRGSAQQSSRQPGVGDPERERTPWDSCFREESKSATRGTECQCQAYGSGCAHDKETMCGKGDATKPDCQTIRGNTGNNFSDSHEEKLESYRLAWCVAGGESGPGARPAKEEWMRDLKNQCVAAGVPFFLKQMVIDGKMVKLPELDGQRWEGMPGATY